MKKIGLIVAMDKEFGLLRGLMSGGRDVSCQGLEFFEGKIGGKDVVLARSGIGKVCAAAGALELIKNFAPEKASFIMTFGAANRTRTVRYRDFRPVLPAAASFLTR